MSTQRECIFPLPILFYIFSFLKYEERFLCRSLCRILRDYIDSLPSREPFLIGHLPRGKLDNKIIRLFYFRGHDLILSSWGDICVKISLSALFKPRGACMTVLSLPHERLFKSKRSTLVEVDVRGDRVFYIGAHSIRSFPLSADRVVEFSTIEMTPTGFCFNPHLCVWYSCDATNYDIQVSTYDFIHYDYIRCEKYMDFTYGKRICFFLDDEGRYLYFTSGRCKSHFLRCDLSTKEVVSIGILQISNLGHHQSAKKMIVDFRLGHAYLLYKDLIRFSFETGECQTIETSSWMESDVPLSDMILHRPTRRLFLLDEKGTLGMISL